LTKDKAWGKGMSFWFALMQLQQYMYTSMVNLLDTDPPPTHLF